MTEIRMEALPAGAVRDRLMEKALELFTTKGYAATSVREIVEATGVSKPVLYYWFGSKEGLYLELMNGALATFETLVAEITAVPGNVRERMIRFCTGLYDGSAANIAIVRLIYAIYFGPPQGAPVFPIDQFFDRMLGILGALVREGVETGELRPIDERDTTWAIVACFNIVLEEQLCHDPPRVDRDGLMRILNLIIDGFAAREIAL